MLSAGDVMSCRCYDMKNSHQCSFTSNSSIEQNIYTKYRNLKAKRQSQSQKHSRARDVIFLKQAFNYIIGKRNFYSRLVTMPCQPANPSNFSEALGKILSQRRQSRETRIGSFGLANSGLDQGYSAIEADVALQPITCMRLQTFDCVWVTLCGEPKNKINLAN